MYKKLINIIKNPKLLLLYIINLKIFHLFKDRTYLKIKYRIRVGRKLNINDSRAFNEKLQWLKLYDRNPIYTRFVDKYEVRSFVKETIGQEYLISLLGVWDEFDEIDFSKLPNQFVLKCTHDSGSVFICKDKNSIDYADLKKRVNKSLKKNFYYLGREWPYKNVEPRIIAEEFIYDESSSDLKDYKFMCFNGKVKCCFVCSNRSDKGGLKVDFYDLNWNKMPFTRHYSNSIYNMSKPKCYDEMIRLSNKLSKGIPFVRVDFYEVNKKVYFGELTFFPGSGFEEFTPESYDYLLGSWIKLPNQKYAYTLINDRTT